VHLEVQRGRVRGSGCTRVSTRTHCPLVRLMAFAGPRDVRILMLGLDAAGESTSEYASGAGGWDSDDESASLPTPPSLAAVLYKLKLGEVVTTIPTIGKRNTST